jgi:hypothetical protein
MSSPAIALVWEIWRQHRWTVAAIAALTAAGRLIDFLETGRSAGGGIEPSPLTTLLGMLAFLCLFAVFNYTDASDGRGVGRFPRRLFTLPVTSLRLVSVPLLAGMASVELLYLLWMGPLSRGGSTSAAFVALLLAALVVFYLWALWTLERAGSLRLVMLGVIATALFATGVLPSFPPTPPPPWRSERVLAGLVAGLALVAFLRTWQHVGRVRAGGEDRRGRRELLLAWIAAAWPARRRAFATPAAAHFWFEWRSSGVVLPALVGGVILVVIMPMSWLYGGGSDTFRLVLATLAAPMVLAIPVGIAFSKPTFWSEELAVPAFVAVRPLSSEDLVATKVAVAAVSAVLSWTVVAVFLTVWLSSSANLDLLSRLAIQLSALDGQSIAAVYGMAALAAVAAVFLTWRFLVSRLWCGLSGMRPMFVGSVVALVVLVVAGLAFDATRLPGWLLAEPARLTPVVWIASIAVIAKYGLAAFTWRRVSPSYARLYLLIWLAGTASFLALGVVVWRLVRVYPPLDIDRPLGVIVLAALLAVPLARVGLAPSMLGRNRHR